MKPFNLEAAKKGAKVCTSEGRKVRILCYDRMDAKYPIVALVGNNDRHEENECYTVEGYFYLGGEQRTSYNLMMVSAKKEGWINIYFDNGIGTGEIFDCKSDAEMTTAPLLDRVATIKIEWEE